MSDLPKRAILDSIGWVERSATHRPGPTSVGCASLHPPYDFAAEVDVHLRLRSRLPIEQRSFLLDTPAVASQLAVAPHHPMTRNRHRTRIRGTCRRHGADGRGFTDR